jgi:excisionase family DNA binding protein
MANEVDDPGEPDLREETLRLLSEILKRLEPPPEVLTVRDLAKLLQISPAQVYKMLERNQIPLPFYIGGCRRLPRWWRSEILLWLSNGALPRPEWAPLKERLLREQPVIALPACATRGTRSNFEASR